MEKLEAYLVLGCGGFRTPSGFLICNSISTPIIDLEEVPDEEYDNLVGFLDKACGLFDSPIYDYNKVGNSLNLLHKMKAAFSKERLHEIQFFLKRHRECGIYIALIMKEDFVHEH